MVRLDVIIADIEATSDLNSEALRCLANICRAYSQTTDWCDGGRREAQLEALANRLVTLAHKRDRSGKGAR